ncbi:unnamed protein product [Sphagnum troendelagicum]|uniref:Uncharacterized protein n=1 Tax=Sphagnum jensenii TaxID=128206 RepID=A0ABP1BUL9_9BRYO
MSIVASSSMSPDASMAGCNGCLDGEPWRFDCGPNGISRQRIAFVVTGAEDHQQEIVRVGIECLSMDIKQLEVCESRLVLRAGGKRAGQFAMGGLLVYRSVLLTWSSGNIS